MNDFIVKIVWIITYFICWPITHVIRPTRISIAQETLNFNSKKKKPLIIVANHKSMFDPWLLSSVIPFKLFIKILPIRILGSLEFKDPIVAFLNKIGLVKFIYRIYGVAGIKPDSNFQEKLEPLVNSLKHDESVLIFPEGHFEKEKDIGDFKRGVVYLYKETLANILPTSINLNYSYHGHRATSINIGRPIKIPKKLIAEEEASDPSFKKSREFLRRKVLWLYRKKTI